MSKVDLKKKVTNWFKQFKSPFVAITFVLILFVVVTYVYVLLWAVISSFKSQLQFGANMFGLPSRWRLDNYVKVFKNLSVGIELSDGNTRYAGFFELLWNSLLFAGLHAVIMVVSRGAVAYVACKYKYKFSNVLYSIVILVMIVPVINSLASSLNWNKTLGVYDNFPMILYTAIGFADSGFLIFFGVFQGIDDTYKEAAEIDGAGHLRIMISIMFPLAKIPLLIMGVQYFIGQWNNYMTPYLYMPSMPTLSVALFLFNQTRVGEMANEIAQMTAAVLVAIPCVVLFLAFRDKMVGNLTMGGIKG